MSRHRRLRMTCESALRVAEWRLGQQQRRALTASVRCESEGAPADVAKRRRLVQLSVLWIAVVALVLSAIELSSWWATDSIEVHVGPLIVALGAAVVIVIVVLAFMSGRWKTRRGGP